MHQQGAVIETQTNLKVGQYTGDMLVDLWNKEKWEEEFNQHDVLVMTHQILYNMLAQGYIGLHNINLMIMDECHNATGGHPYSRIMEFHDVLQNDKQAPHIMGLTASIINKKYKKDSSESSIKAYLEKQMRDLECRLRSVCVTCSDPQATSKFATRPVESIKTFCASPKDSSDFPEVAKMVGIVRSKLEDVLNFVGEFSLFH